ncbi:MAG: large ribosomal subunit protein bL35 [Planctomycetota bacterium]
MGKQKTHKGLSKRVKVTGSGKVRRKRAGAGHLMSTKNAKHRRRVTGSALVTGAAARKAKVQLGK